VFHCIKLKILIAKFQVSKIKIFLIALIFVLTASLEFKFFILEIYPLVVGQVWILLFEN